MPRTWLFGCLILLASGCSSSTGPELGSSSKTTETPYQIAVVPKATSLQYWKAVHAGAVKAAEELGNVEVIWKGPAKESDTAGQIEVVRNMITRQVDGICIAPNHSEALISVVQEANDEGIPVVVFDSGIGQGVEIVSYVATDNRNAGRLAAKRLAEVLNDEGDVILLRYRAGSESTGEREEGFLEEIKKHTKIRVLSSDQYGEATALEAMRKSTQLLLRYRDDVDGVFAVCEPNCHGLLQALLESGLAGKVKFVAFDPSDILIEAMKEGNIHGIVVQDPVNIGYLAVRTMVDHLEGRPVEKRVPTGEYVATPENLETERIQQLLYPAMYGE